MDTAVWNPPLGFPVGLGHLALHASNSNPGPQQRPKLLRRRPHPDSERPCASTLRASKTSCARPGMERERRAPWGASLFIYQDLHMP